MRVVLHALRANNETERMIENITTSLSPLSSSSLQAKKYKSPYLWDLPFWNSLNFLNIAKASLRCNAYYTSFLYLELWIEKV
jgi:hypothetical protein